MGEEVRFCWNCRFYEDCLGLCLNRDSEMFAAAPVEQKGCKDWAGDGNG